jgi:hypothetical protein
MKEPSLSHRLVISQRNLSPAASFDLAGMLAELMVRDVEMEPYIHCAIMESVVCRSTVYEVI